MGSAQWEMQAQTMGFRFTVAAARAMLLDRMADCTACAAAAAHLQQATP